MRISASDKSWMAYGECRNEDPDALFVTGAAQQEAKIICRPCPVKIQCMLFALATKTPYGVWGGLTERERRALNKDYPSRDWLALQSTFVDMQLSGLH